MDNVFNSLKSVSLNVANRVTPVLKASSFTETGYITPEEFVEAGDFLVHHCPTWRWSGGHVSCAEAYLPKDKQMLVTNNVPSLQRVRSVMLLASTDISLDDFDTVIGAVDEGIKLDDWVVSDFESVKPVREFEDNAGFLVLEHPNDDMNQIQLVDKIEESKNQSSVVVEQSKAIEEDEAPLDMDEFEKDNKDLFEDDSTVNFFTSAASKKTEGDENEGCNVIVASRTYDLAITYDNYYRTPRFWLLGYDKSRRPLTIKEMYEDISAEHANKTVTIERNPHMNGLAMASVHPCKHASLMKKLLQTASQNISDNKIPVHWYLIVFLKFVQTVVPTIQYDFTRNCPF